jgi:hypothetical protein
MRKLSALVAVAAVAFVPAGALAAKPKPGHKHASPRAKAYKATLKPFGPDAAYVTTRFGRAQLVDGKKNNKVSVHVRGLTPGVSYLWHVHQAKAAGDPCDASASGVANPAPYPAFDYPASFTPNAAGNYNKTLKSKTFPVTTPGVDSGFVYYVNVHLADGTVIACGVFKGSRKATPKYKKTHAKKGHGKGPKAHRH